MKRGFDNDNNDDGDGGGGGGKSDSGSGSDSDVDSGNTTNANVKQPCYSPRNRHLSKDKGDLSAGPVTSG